jgi:prepilin signal peptidase PulO-like enzyme (type II secretory pathway)
VHGKGHAAGRGQDDWIEQNGACVMVERVPLAVLGALVGFVLGWGSARVTEWFASADADPNDSAGGDEPGFALGRLAAGAPAWQALVPDPLVQGGAALAWAAAFLLLEGEWWRPVAAGLMAVPLIQVAVTDLRTRYVYTAIAAVGLLLGLAFGWQLHGVAWFWSLFGAIGGFVGFGGLWLLGKLLYKGKEALARGDITIAAMVGAGAAACAAQALVAGVLLGGLFAIGMLVVRRSRHEFMPYGPGLCLGGIATLFVC